MKQTFLTVLCFAGMLTGSASADLASLTARQQKLDAALDKVSPALVSVEDGFGAGSGIVVSGDGIVLTASHVVDTHRRNRPNPRLKVVFPDGSRYQAKLLGMNRSDDAAMLKITESPRNGKEFPFVDLGESDKLSRGDWCFALGHPGGFNLERPAPVRLGRVLSVGHRTVVSDCAIVLGDSGGPLFDMSGKLIGIHSMITEVIVENRHVAIDCFRRDGDRMENGESWGRLVAHDNDLAETDFMGVHLRWRSFTPEVSRVIRNSPADKAGLRSGDILLKVADQQFADPLGLSNLLDHLASHQQTTLVVDRNGRETSLSLTTGAKPDGRDRRRSETREVEVDSDDHERIRELTNQLTSLRTVGPYEKRAPEELARFEPSLRESSQSVVEIRRYGETLTLGTIMSSDGYIMTKASEIENVKRCDCILPDGRSVKFVEVATDFAYDLMLIKVNQRGLTPVSWNLRSEVKPGRIVITTDSRGAPLLPGVISVASRKLPTSTKGFLGVQLKQVWDEYGNKTAVGISNVFAGGAAKRYGVLEGDQVLSIDGVTVRTSEDMMRKVKSMPPYSKITLRIDRNDEIKTLEIVLTPKFIDDRQAMLERYQDPKNYGRFASTHNSGFPEAIQHDTDLYPRQCGGPLFDISGRAVGLNIARAARITSYAIPASAVVRVYEQLRVKGAQPASLKKAG